MFHVVKHLCNALSLTAGASLQVWNGPPALAGTSTVQPQLITAYPVWSVAPGAKQAAVFWMLLKVGQRPGQRMLRLRPPTVDLYLILAFLHSVNARFWSFRVFRLDGFLPPTWTKKACSKGPPTASLSPFKSGTVCDLLFSENLIKISRKTTQQYRKTTFFFFFFWIHIFHQPVLSSVTHQVHFSWGRF